MLRYTKVETFSGSPLAGNTYYGNGPYDPEYAVGGDQPVGYDQYAAFYTRYRVYACNIRVHYIPTGTTTVPFYCALAATTDTTATTTPRLLSQQPYSKTLICYSVAPFEPVLSMNMTTAEIRGEPAKKVEYDDVFTSAVTSVPTSLWYYNVSAEAIDASTNISGYFLVELTYDVEFYQRKLLSQS